GGHRPDAEAVARLRRTMSEDVGVVRDARGLRHALRVIAALEADQADVPAFRNMAATATLIAAAALQREESRGGHYRSDFPETRHDMAHRSRLTLDEALALREALVELDA
ncbi:MAG: L-aspartate oxidase, partial [Mangrovicoccus sp.]|nr:L-aspartate oxidase [Mangrovicoccus sp.]